MNNRPANPQGMDFLATWLDSPVSRAFAETMVAHPSGTIVPHLAGADSGAARAMAHATHTALDDGNVPGFTSHATLGEGGMGIVRLAMQNSLGREVAIKTLRADSALDPAARISVLREAWVAGRLEHPNIAPVYDLCIDETGRPHIVMRRIVGTSWDSLLNDDVSLAEKHAPHDRLEWHLRVLLQLTNAISRAHAERIIHRDIKPENVMIGQYGEVYVVDWGIALSLIDDSSGRLPLARDVKEIAGTPAYMAPEMLEGDGSKLGEHTDIYLLGATLYELVEGRPPHSGADLSSLVLSISQGVPRFGAHWPSELQTLCRRATQVEPAARVASVHEFRMGIEQFLIHRSSAELAQRAHDQVRSLLDRCVQPSPERQAIYAAFGELRAQFREALRTWSDNQVAIEGLRTALCAVAEFELDHGSPEAAQGLLAECTDPPLRLRERAAEAVAARAADRERLAKLSRLENQLDPNIGRATRAWVMSIAGIVGTIGLLAVALIDGTGEVTATSTLVRASIALAFAIGLLYWARDSMSKTRLNRGISWGVLIGLVNQILLVPLCLMLDIPLRQHMTLSMYSWALLTGLGAVAFEKVLAIPSIVILVGAFLGARYPVWRYVFLPLGHLSNCVTVLLLWGRRSDLRLAGGRGRQSQSAPG